MRCRRSKELESTLTYTQLTSESMIEIYTPYATDFDRNSYEVIIDNGDMLELAEGTLKVDVLDNFEGHIIIDNVVKLTVSQTLYVKTKDGIEDDYQALGCTIIGSSKTIMIKTRSGFSNIYTNLYSISGHLKMRGLAFFGSYGSQLKLKNTTCLIATGTPRYFSDDELRISFPNRYAFYVFRMKRLTSITVTVDSSYSGMFYLFRVYYDTHTYQYEVQMYMFSSYSKTFTLSGNIDDISYQYFTIYTGIGEDITSTSTITYDKPVYESIKTEDGETFAKEQEAVACSLTQRLSIIRGELWYQINTGLPLFDKSVSSTTLDAWVLKTIQQHPDVVSITSFSSRVDKTHYHCDVVIMTRWGEIEITI